MGEFAREGRGSDLTSGAGGRREGLGKNRPTPVSGENFRGVRKDLVQGSEKIYQDINEVSVFGREDP